MKRYRVRRERLMPESFLHHLDYERRLRTKGPENVDRYLTRNLCAVLAVALCRLQHGVKRNLTSVAFFT